VDDNEDFRSLVASVLSAAHLSCVEASSGEAGLAIARAAPDQIDAIVLDVVMDGLSGLEVLERLKATPETLDIPVILMTGSAKDDEDVVTGVHLGACDYICKPCAPSVLVAKVGAWCARAQADRVIREELASAWKHALNDPLTGLMNRRTFDARLLEATSYAARHGGAFSIVMIDIDHFKDVNDIHGHPAGDKVLVAFAQALRSVLRAEDTAFRFGGEEFVLLLQACDVTRAVGVTQRLRDAARSHPFRFEDNSVHVISFSAGVAAAADGLSGEDLVRLADEALYRAKANGRDRTER
jgi:two-component system cell cycle response regulator